jgi:hypothetical protein
MTTIQLVEPVDQPIAVPQPSDSVVAPAQAARVRFRQPISTAGFIDAAWWPRSLDLTAELPPLFDVLWTADRDITRISYNLAAWSPAPRLLNVNGRRIRLGGFTSSDPLTVRLVDAWGKERIDVLVIAPTTDPAVAERALWLASEADGPYRAGEILARAALPPEATSTSAA